MGFSASDVVPFTQARANLSELADQAKAGAEKIITKNGESYVALIDAELLPPPGARAHPPAADRRCQARPGRY
jgi:prevent-host-death family protein